MISIIYQCFFLFSWRISLLTLCRDSPKWLGTWRNFLSANDVTCVLTLNIKAALLPTKFRPTETLSYWGNFFRSPSTIFELKSSRSLKCLKRSAIAFILLVSQLNFIESLMKRTLSHGTSPCISHVSMLILSMAYWNVFSGLL